MGYWKHQADLMMARYRVVLMSTGARQYVLNRISIGAIVAVVAVAVSDSARGVSGQSLGNLEH